MNKYEIITNHILAQLEKGIAPWRKGWSSPGQSGCPKNLITKKDYRGINVLLLGTQGYSSPYWLTYKQCSKLGGFVRRGEKNTPIIFWSRKETQDETKPQWFLTHWQVFNLAQCEGIDLPKEEEVSTRDFEPIHECENLVKAYKMIPRINHGLGRAFYSPTFDHIGMPKKEDFHSSEEYYSTLFHELVHSTGHETRLNRDGIMNPIKFGSHDYSFEELIAECGSAFLCGRAGIDNKVIDNQVAYLSNWIAKLKSEPRWIVEAASKAQKAVDFMLGDKEEEQHDSAID